jgi:hypothetical protein
VSERIDVRAMTALSGGHCAVDFAGGALYVLIPYLHDEFDLSYTLARCSCSARRSRRRSSSRCSGSGRTGAARSGCSRRRRGGGIGMALAAVAPAYWLVVVS